MRNASLRCFSRSLIWGFLTACCWGACLAEDAAILTAARTLHVGGLSSFTLTTFSTETRLPIERSAVVQLIALDGSRKLTIFEGTTGPKGQHHGQFGVPADWSGSQLIQAKVAGLNETLEVAVEVKKTLGLLIETDKPIYKPGQSVLGRVVLLNSELQPVSEDVEVTFHDAKGLRIARYDLTASEFGVAQFSLDLAKELNFGPWRIKAVSGHSESVRDIRVEEYVLPRFELLLNFPRPWALVDEQIRGSVEAAYFFGQSVQGSVLVTAKRWVGTWEEYARVEGELSTGEFDFTLPAVGYVAGTPESGRLGSVMVEVSVEDSSGNVQSASEILTISPAEVVIGLVPASQSLKPGLTNVVLVQTSSPEGMPIDADVLLTAFFFGFEGTLLERWETTLTTSQGLAELAFTSPVGTGYAEFEASTVAREHTAQTQIRVGGAYSPANSFLRLSSNLPAHVKPGRVVNFSVASTSGSTIFYEVFAAGRTVLSDATDSNSFAFTVTPEMIPRARVVAYQVDPNNEVLADSCSFEVSLDLSLTVSSYFDPAQVRPGEAVEVILDAGTGRRTLLGISVVDESVLALGKSRLHLAEVFDELERRFVEPQIEIHEGDAGPAPPVGGFWAPVQTPGTLDILQSAGLDVDASNAIFVPQGGFLENFLDVPVSPPPGGHQPAAPQETRVRHYFPETWIWEPALLTDDWGRAKLTITAPDSITSWRLSVVSTVPDSASDAPGIGFGEADLVAFQEFFVEPSLPYTLVRGETLTARVDVFNYLDEAQEVSLRLADTAGFDILDRSELSTTVPPSSVYPVFFSIRPNTVGEVPFQLTAISESASDAVLRWLNVVPEGIPVEQLENGIIRAGEKALLEVTRYPEMIEDSHRAFLYLSPSPVAQTMSGTSDLLGMPYGCGEQNMIFLAPDIEILKYLREIGELSPEVWAKAEYFVNVGYQRQLTFQTGDGGFSAFGEGDGSLWLTAFVLSTFSGAREIRDLDESVIGRAAEMLIARQLADGSFKTDDFLIHQEMDGGLENLYAMAAYTANALAEYGAETVETPLDNVAGYLISNEYTVWDDPYSLSIAAVALFRSGYDSAAETLLDRLLELATLDGDGLHWEPYPVETTGYAATALMMSWSGGGRPEAQPAIEWLASQRNSLGGYGRSTQDTVVALRAMFLAARQVRRDLDVNLTVWQGDRLLQQFSINETNFDFLQQAALPTDVGTLELRSAGTGNVVYQWVQRYHVPGQMLPPSRDMKLEVGYVTDHVQVDDLVDVRVTLVYTGPKERTGMVILDVGVPTGFEPVRDSLKTVVEETMVEKSEVAGRKVIFYIESLSQNEVLRFEFQIKALYPVRTEGVISSAYEYYDSKVEAYDRFEGVEVGPHPVRPEVNRDSIRRSGLRRHTPGN